MGLLFSSFQVGQVVYFSPASSVSGSYSQLCAWDCVWYSSIARDGYRSTIPPVRQNPGVSNVAFFPGYPYLIRGLYLGTGIDPKFGSVLIAQIACVAFWASLWLLLKTFAFSFGSAAIIAVLCLVHPAAFYLISGYSESLFLLSLMLYLVYSTRVGRLSYILGASSGFIMSATRLIGLPLVSYPVFIKLAHSFFSQRDSDARDFSSMSYVRALSVGMAASFGTLFFLIYCQIQFGNYGLYLLTQKIGWGVSPDYLSIFKWADFQFMFPWDKVAVYGSAVFFIALGMVETAHAFSTKPLGGISRRLPLYIIALIIFYVTLCGLKNVNFLSMIRYSLPWYILLLICSADLVRGLHVYRVRAFRVCFMALVFVLIALSYSLQCLGLQNFLNGQWFA